MVKLKTALLCLLAIAPICAAGCGGARKAAKDGSSGAAPGVAPASALAPLVRSTPASRRGIKDSYDGDDSAGRFTEEDDDAEVEQYGQPSSPAEVRAARAFVKAYYTAAATENGAAACKLLEPSTAQGIGGSYEKPGRLHYLSGKTCPEVMTKLFVHEHKLAVAEAAGVEVARVRHNPGTMFVLLAFKGVREPRMMGLQQSGGALKLEAIRDSPYP